MKEKEERVQLYSLFLTELLVPALDFNTQRKEEFIL